MQNNILFDNIYIGHSEEDAKKFAEESWVIKHTIEKEAEDEEMEQEVKDVYYFGLYMIVFWFPISDLLLILMLFRLFLNLSGMIQLNT